MIEVDRLSRHYGDLKAAHDVSFRIGPGEVVGLLGHNGAGKTTIMKMLTGFLEPSAGSVRIDGLDIGEDRRAVQARIGYLPENCPVYPEMTVIDFLEFQAALHGVPAENRPAAIRSAIARTELEAKAAETIDTLSRGYRQRVGVAQAILHEPAILILDEPTNGLDPSQILHMRNLIRDLSKRATLIISTHILQEVEAVCDRVLIMRSGSLALDARLDELATPSRLLVTLDRGPAEATPLLARLDTITTCVHLESGDKHHLYALESNDPTAAAPRVASAVSDAGWPLYGLSPETRDLETLFGEINATEAAHGLREEASHA
jgi:ABC-2 type transport system ATP-binding protein